MTLEKTLQSYLPDIGAWRRDIHQHPELGFNEHRTADLVAKKLESFGLEVHRGLATTGVVGTLRAGTSSRAIGLRADMDALPIQELNSFKHCSVHPKTMHACGHDGHTAMLLGAAACLAKTKQFDGTVHFIFQPAEEGDGGAQAMVEEGLFEQFPVDSVYGLHNWPGLAVGQFGVCSGAMMASADTFEITVRGVGAHAAMPHTGIDPVVVAAQVITALQTLVSRNVAPIDAAVISVTQVNTGSAFNIVPAEAVLKGCVRTQSSATQALIKARMQTLVTQICSAFGATGSVELKPITPVLINTQAETDAAILAAQSVVGEARVDTQYPPTMGSEDFAYMLQQRPGCYVFLGNGQGDGTESGGCMLHNARYDFNDDAIEWGVSYWCRLVESLLKIDAGP